MISNRFRYKNVFLYASLQFCGNIEEYFAKNTQKLVVFIVQPRIKNRGNLLRVYKEGSIIEHKEIELSENIFLYYFLWYINYIKFIFKYFTRGDKVVVITSHPISFFGMGIQRLLRNVRFVFWIEYFPRANLTLRLFDDLKNFYHKRVDFAGYFGDRVNELMNGKVVNTKKRRTILWGVKPRIIRKGIPQGPLTMLFVGLIKESQGLDLIFSFLKENKEYKLNIIGVCDDRLYKKYKKLFAKYRITNQVYFPNKFIPSRELETISKKCFVGVAPYLTGSMHGTYYIDPGKIKEYAELGLPIIMSNTSIISPYIKKFNAGEIIKRDVGSLRIAIEKIKKNYDVYLGGLNRFNDYFYYEGYYAQNFAFLEDF